MAVTPASCVRCLSVRQLTDAKMSENFVFHSQTKSIVETAVKTAVHIVSSKEENNSEERRKPDFDSVVEMLSREATRKISAVFSQLFSMLHNENATLKSEVGELQSKLKTVTVNFENTRKWRENVLSGCPVLFEQSGLLFSLKPFGKLEVNKSTLMERVTGSAPETQTGQIAALMSCPGGGQATKEVNSEAQSAPASRQDLAQDCAATNTTQSPNTTSQNTQDAVIRKKDVLVCNVCNKSFDRQFHLLKHMNTHKEQRTLACSQCPRRFRNTAAFEYHLLRHEEKKYASFKCQLCDKTFKTKMHLKTHQIVHTGHEAVHLLHLW
ncbi:Zinc finger protein Gfi-1b [Nibea albiflora]|uniref:Zinc finger protein Gfi-1b n=1 Tax=Nibea albiflora TaxID=240163 RepID=A0ACB7EHU0_NIBAL|nr:Zinc finger protein Gfi-1b [Nibea albiflora]